VGKRAARANAHRPGPFLLNLHGSSALGGVEVNRLTQRPENFLGSTRLGVVPIDAAGTA